MSDTFDHETDAWDRWVGGEDGEPEHEWIDWAGIRREQNKKRFNATMNELYGSKSNDQYTLCQ